MLKKLYARLVLWLIAPALGRFSSESNAGLSPDEAAEIRRAVCAIAARGGSCSEVNRMALTLRENFEAIRDARPSGSQGTPHRSL